MNSDTVCDLEVNENGLKATSSFTYSFTITPKLTSASPLRGGTGGGTLLTIVGTNFPNDKDLVNITIADSQCDVTIITSTQISCQTGSYAYSSTKSPIKIFIQNQGYALNVYNNNLINCLLSLNYT